jgi:hypothetical protein
VTVAVLVARSRPAPGSVSVSVSAASVSTVVFDGPPGQLSMITSGHLSATFLSPPRQLAVTLLSAQATVSLPAGPAYRLSQQVTSGYLRASVPQSPSASRTISAQITSGELELVTR